MKSKRCTVVGVLDNGTASLNHDQLRLVQQADVIIGGIRVLSLLAQSFKPSVISYDLTGALSKVPAWVQQALRDELNVVVLATGDPLCHGIAKYLIDKLGADCCEVIPNVSTLQWACARFGVAWQDIKICSIHNKDSGEWQRYAGPEHGLYDLLQALRQHNHIAVFTSPQNTPDRIARMLIAEGMSDEFNFSVAENLLCENEILFPNLRITEVANRIFAPTNVVIIKRTEKRKTLPIFGLTDDAFHQRKPEKGLITKREVRAVSLAMLQLKADSVVWDIGAGSGSVGLEAARLCRQGHVYAIEKNSEDFGIAEQNRQTLQVTNYSLRHAKAPDGLEGWPDPDAIFIGGSGGELRDLIALCLTRLRTNGTLVMNFVTLENFIDAVSVLKEINAQWSVTQIGAARSQPLLHMHRLAAENPVWVVSAQRLEQGAEQ